MTIPHLIHVRHHPRKGTDKVRIIVLGVSVNTEEGKKKKKKSTKKR